MSSAYPTYTTIPSTGTCPAEWRQWWATESRRNDTDLQSLLRQHGRVLREFWQHSQTLLSSH
jgi:hypothetical protein